MSTSLRIFATLIILLTTSLALPAQDRFNPEERSRPTPIQAVLDAAVSGWQGDLEGLIAGVLNSPGDALEVKLKLEVSGGALGGGGGLLEIMGTFSKSDSGKIELAVTGDLRAFAGAELIQDVEAKLAGGLNAKVVFAFDTERDAAQALAALAYWAWEDELLRFLAIAKELRERIEGLVEDLRNNLKGALKLEGIRNAAVTSASRALSRVPRRRAFNGARRAAQKRLSGARTKLAAARSSARGLRSNLDIRTAMQQSNAGWIAEISKIIQNQGGLLGFVRDHFAAIEVNARVHLEGEVKVDLLDALVPGISLQGDQFGAGVKLEVGCGMRFTRGSAGDRHQAAVMLMAELSGELEGAIVLGLKGEAKLGLELGYNYVIPRGEEQSWVHEVQELVNSAPSVWIVSMARIAEEHGLQQLDQVRAKIKRDTILRPSAAIVVGVAMGIGREISVELEGDDAVLELFKAVPTEPQSDATSVPAQVVALVNRAMNDVDMKDTPATFTVQDRLEGGLLFMIGYGAAQIGGAISGSAMWIDKGPARSEKLSLRDGFSRLASGRFLNWVANLQN